MLDHQRIVGDLQAALSGAAPATEDLLQLALADFAQACDEVNDRLRRCGALLKQGLRAEAVHQAELEPKLLDLVATLDFPELDTVGYVARLNGLVPPPPLLVEVAADLNEAYAALEPLAESLKIHRLQALARAPLALRIGTLRQLARLDADNPVWLEDVAAFEAERLKEIQREGNAAAKRQDAPQLKRLLDEVELSPWRQPPPRALRKSLAAAYENLIRKQARGELDGLEQQLNNAFAAFDGEQGRRARERWEHCAALCGLAGDEEVAVRAAPALEWLAEEDRREAELAEHAAATSRLEEALAGDVDADGLDRLYHAAVRYGHELPPPLRRRYESRRADLEVSSRRRARLYVSAAAAGVLLALGAVAAGIVYQLHRGAVGTASEALAALLKDERLDEAQAYLARLSDSSPRVAGSAEVQRLAVKLEELTAREALRRESFAEALRRAQGGGAESPDAQALERARQLARLDDEKAQIARFEADVAAARRAWQSEADGQFKESLDKLAGRLQELEAPGQRADVELWQRAIDEARSELKSLESANRHVTAALREQVKPLLARLATLDTLAQRQALEAALLADVTGAVGDRLRYGERLQALAAKFPETPRAVDVARAAEELGLHDGMTAWNSLAANWNRIAGRAMSSINTAALVKQCEEFAAAHGHWPQCAVLAGRLDLLRHIAARSGGSDGTSLIGQLRALYSDTLMVNLWMVEIRDNQRLDVQRMYLRREPVDRSDRIDFEYLTGFGLGTMRRSVVSGSVIFSARAPQSVLADDVLAELDHLSTAPEADAWEQAFVKIVERIMGQERLEPILKVLLLKQTVGIACRGSLLLSEGLARYCEMLEDSKVSSFADWVAPDNADARNARSVAEAELKNLTGLVDAVRRAAAGARQQLDEQIAPTLTEYRWAGWLYRDGQGQWRCEGRPLERAAGQLVVAVQPVVDGPVRLLRIGQVNTGSVRVDSANSEALLEGRAVWLADDKQPPAGQ